MPTPLQTIDFFAHHSPFGAFASFTLGRFGKSGGFGLELGGPATDQDVYVGVSRSGETIALPFYREARENASHEATAYTGEASGSDASRPAWRTFSADEIRRTMGWASDTWSAGALTFSLKTPFCPIPDLDTLGDDELRHCVCPVLLAELTLDNRESSEAASAFFAIRHADPLRPLGTGDNSALRGIARAGEWGFAVRSDNSDSSGSVQECLSWDLLDFLSGPADAAPPRHLLSNLGGLRFQAAPGETKTWTMALGFYRSGIATTGIAAAYLYTRLFSDLESVLTFALEHESHFTAVAAERDRELDNAPLSDERKFLLAHATHSYHGSTMLLNDERGVLPRPPFSPSAPLHRPLWVVNEGEYRMLNTFDLTVDHAFWEMRFHPWTLKNTLDLFVSRYSYQDEVKDTLHPEQPLLPGGLSFTHDMGVANQFTPPGSSSYEQPNIDGCFSYMTQEQLCNWCLCAALYALPTSKSLTLPKALPKGQRSGDLLWLTVRRSTLHACLTSLLHRDGAEGERNGVMTLDSARCGTGQEITTYDSLDASLGRSRNSLYLAVKTWAAYLALSRCFDALGEDDKAAEAEEQAARAAGTISRHWDSESEMFPAVLEPGSPGSLSRIIPAVEALVYPHLLGDLEAVSPFGPFGELVANLRSHLKSVLASGICVDAESGGFKLSSSSNTTWMSKIFLAQFVAETVLAMPLSPAYDSAHAHWQRDGDCRDHAFTDQVRASDGKDLGSRFYPRGVTAILWLHP